MSSSLIRSSRRACPGVWRALPPPPPSPPPPPASDPTFPMCRTTPSRRGGRSTSSASARSPAGRVQQDGGARRRARARLHRCHDRECILPEQVKKLRGRCRQAARVLWYDWRAKLESASSQNLQAAAVVRVRPQAVRPSSQQIKAAEAAVAGAKPALPRGGCRRRRRGGGASRRSVARRRARRHLPRRRGGRRASRRSSVTPRRARRRWRRRRRRT